MRQAVITIALIILGGAACATGAQAPSVPPPVQAQKLLGQEEQLQQAQKAFDEGLKLCEAGRYPEAMRQVERSLEIREAVLGKSHPEVAESLNALASLYQDLLLYERAEPLYVRALAIREAAFGGSHAKVALSLNNLGTLYHALKNYERAEPLLTRALEIREAVFGENHPVVAASLDNLASLYSVQKFHERTEALYARALRIREAALGGDHPRVATSLTHLANFYQQRRRYKEAEPLLTRAIRIWEATLGERHLQVAALLNNLAGLYLEQGLYSRAEPLFQRALGIREAILGGEHLEVADTLNNLAGIFYEQGLYPRAEASFKRALEIREARLGKDHPDVAILLNNLGGLYRTMGLYPRAEVLHLRALEIRRVAFGEGDPGVANSLQNLATVYISQGLYPRAEALYLQAIRIQEAALGKDHPDVAISIDNLAGLYKAQGFYARAEPLYARALGILRASLGENHPSVATCLNNFAGLYQEQSSLGHAEFLYTRARSIQEATLSESHPSLATTLNNLADLYKSQRRYADAEPLQKRALTIFEAALGEGTPQVAASLNNLASLYKGQGRYTAAEPLYARALGIYEATLGENHPEVAACLHNLAGLYRDQGLYARARPLYARSLKILEAVLNENHPNVATSLENLALLHLAQKNLDEALPLFQRAFTSSEQHLRQEAFGFSEKRLETFLGHFRHREDRLYTLVRAHPGNPRVLQVALSAALLRRGRFAQEIANTSLIVHRSLSQPDRDAFERLRTLRTQLTALYLADSDSLVSEAYMQRIEELTVQGDLLEAELARRSEPLRRLHELPSPAHIISRVSAALPRDGVLVEFVVYPDHLLGRGPDQAPGAAVLPLRYLAFLLFPDGRNQAIDLGPVEPIDRAAVQLHDALANQTDYLSAAQKLYSLAFRPLLAHLGKAQRLFVTPDGQLNLVPFAALHDGKRFLVEAFHITYLGSGKDLLHRSAGLRPAGSVLVMADPAFGSDAPWEPLPDTRTEAEAIQRLFPSAQLLLGSRATRQSLLNVSAPGILHIATHGFFLRQAAPAGKKRAVASLGPLAARMPECPAHEPLLCSGLLLAGAAASEAPSISDHIRESWVSALELAGLDLWGTQLVVLSACDTGRGEIQFGQGVAGLRRAFLEAGAETLVASLWKVEDNVTRELMEGYYRHLLGGQGRSAALREAMKELRHERPHPHFWAPFIALGQDAPLQGFAAVSLDPNTPR